MSETMDINEIFIEDVALRLPELPPIKRKNLYDILGVQRKEIINSKVLAYFLDANEEHEFETLFLISLKNLIKSKIPEQNLEAFEGNFSVETEVSTSNAEDEIDKRKRIDITIEGENWCIIIENKLFHMLQNPLKTYWQHFHKKYPENKIGIVLSLSHIPSDELIVNNSIKYVNITHEELIEQVQKNFNLADYNNDTDIFYLREYLKTITSHYTNKKNQPIMDKIIQELIKQRDNIDKIEKTKKKALDFIKKEISEIFASKGFEEDGNGHFCHPNSAGLIFVVDINNILNNNRLWFSLEIWDTNKDNIDRLMSDFKELKLSTNFISYGNGDVLKNGKLQLAIYDESNFIDGQTNFSEKFKSILDNYFFEEKGIMVLTEAEFEIEQSI